MIISRLYALVFLLVLLPAPMQAEITVMTDLDGGEGVGEPARKDMRSLQHATAVRAHQGASAAVGQDIHSKGVTAYKLNAGDNIAIRVFGEDSLSLDVVLDGSSVINYPFLGKIFVKGLTTESLAQILTDGLSDGYLVDPHVNVSIVKYRPFFITGRVSAPGSYSFEPGLTVKKAVSLAGGFTEEADKGNITIVYEGRSKERGVEVELNSEIHPGDTISIGEIGYFFVDGEVKKPGRYPYQVGLTLRKAISIAGGYTEHAAKGSISLLSNNDVDERPAHLNDIIHSGDSIMVDESLF